MMSNVTRIISCVASMVLPGGRAAQASRRPRAAPIMAGMKALTADGRKTGDARRRWKRQRVPSAVSIPVPSAGTKARRIGSALK
jgi:hypothetical protein